MQEPVATGGRGATQSRVDGIVAHALSKADTYLVRPAEVHGCDGADAGGMRSSSSRIAVRQEALSPEHLSGRMTGGCSTLQRTWHQRQARQPTCARAAERYGSGIAQRSLFEPPLPHVVNVGDHAPNWMTL